jgi:hypothetical protein
MRQVLRVKEMESVLGQRGLAAVTMDSVWKGRGERQMVEEYLPQALGEEVVV